MLGWLDARIVRGHVLFDSRDIVAIDERGWRELHGRHIGFIPQNSMSGLDPVMTIGHQLGETLRHLRGSRPKAPDVLALLAQVRMPHPREIYASYPHQLSGGMRQRVMIALAIAGQPELLVADEPTTALDVTVQREILDLMMDLQRQSRMGLVLVSHDLDVVARVSDQVAIMYSGATVEVGATSDVLTHPAHPYTRALLDSRPSVLGIGRRLYAIPGYPPDPRSWPPGCRFAPRCPLAVPECELRLPPAQMCSRGGYVRCVRAGEIVPQKVEERAT